MTISGFPISYFSREGGSLEVDEGTTLEFLPDVGVLAEGKSLWTTEANFLR